MGLAPCRGQCKRIKKEQIQLQINTGRYANGQVRCSGCDLFLNYEPQWGRTCPCCHACLRFKAKNSEFRKRGRIYI